MAKIIIVEGIDRVGKTTLCNMLNSEIDSKIFKYDSKIIDVNSRINCYETDKLLLTLELLKLTNKIIILDRFHLTEYVYGVLNRGYDLQTALDNFNLVDEKLNKDVMLVLVNPTDVNISSKKHGSDLSKHDVIFNQLFEKSKISTKIKCNYYSLNEIKEYIKEVLK